MPILAPSRLGSAAIVSVASNAAWQSSAGQKSAHCRAAWSTDRYHGISVACFIEGAGAGPKETARLELASDGTAAVYVGSAAVGQGLETVMAQIAADTHGIPLDQVHVFHGSTSYLNEGYGAFASRSTILGGSAVFEDARSLLEKIRAAPPLGLAAPPPKSNWSMAAPASATAARSPSPNWRRTVCGSTLLSPTTTS